MPPPRHLGMGSPPAHAQIAPGAPKAVRRGSSPASASVSASASDSDESWICSPPDTPTPAAYLSFPMKARMVPFSQRMEKAALPPSSSSSSQSSKAASHDSPRTPKARRVSAGPTMRYRAPSMSELTDTDTGTDSEDDGEIDQVRDTLIDIDQRTTYPTSDGMDAEGDEVDSVLVPNDQDLLMTPIPPTREKGKRRMVSPTSDDGDDEAEAEGMLSIRDKGKRPMKMARVLSPSLSPDIKMAPSSESMYDVCKGMNKLHARSTIINMKLDDSQHRLLPPAARRAQLKRADAVVNARQATRQTKGLQHKRGHQPCAHRRLTASAGSYVALPVFQPLTAPLLSAVMEKAASLMDISMAEISKHNDGNSQSAEAALAMLEKRFSQDPAPKHDVKPFRRQIVDIPGQVDVKDSQLLRTSKIRACYEPAIPLTHVQLVAIESDLSNPATGIHRRPRRSQYPERIPSKSTSHLHRSSPSSLLPWWEPRRERNRRWQRKEQQNQLRLPASFYMNKRHRDVRPAEFMSCIVGQAYVTAVRQRADARISRRKAVKDFNKRTEEGAWRSMIGKWWGYEQVSTLSSKWWLQRRVDQVPRVDEVAVENLLPSEDTAMASPSPEQAAAPKRKRTEREEVDEVLCEVQDRRSRLDGLRTQQLEEYRAVVRQQETKQEQRRLEDEVRRARAVEAVRVRAAEMAERRLADREARREAERVRDLERLMAERQAAEAEAEAAAAQEEAEREQEAARLLRVPSPSPSESSTASDPPEYEFPFFPVVMARPAHLPAPTPTPVRAPTRRAAPSSPYSPPAYLPDRYTNRSPPPPPPYNARTDCQTLIAPLFIEDEDEPEFASPLVPARSFTRSPSTEPEMRIVGSFPTPAGVALHAPRPRRQPFVDPIRAFESALELEEGADEDEALVEGAFDTWQEDGEEEEDDVMPGGAVSGVFQRVFGLVWGGGRR